MNRKLFLVGDINSSSMGVLMQSLMILDDMSDEPIDLYINSGGGEIHSGLAVYHYITEQLRSPIRTYCIGTVASMGAVLYLSGGERYMYRGTEIMIHEPASISGMSEKPDQLKDRLEILEKAKMMLCRIIADRTEHTLEEITEITKKDAFYDADEAVKFGLATDIIGKEAV